MDQIKNIPIFIISYNRLDDLQRLVSFLEKTGYKNIHIVDNKSSYPPLLEYYKTLPYIIHRMDKNYGHRVLFEAPEFREVISNNYFVLTDSDVLPVEECPEDFLQVFMDLLKKYKKVTKVGFSLKIDDLPDHYQLKEPVLLWERRFYSKPLLDEPHLSYNAKIDTTFALYRPITSLRKFKKVFYVGIRTAYPYAARHLPWYKDLEKPTDEDRFYRQTANKNVNNWNGLLSASELKQKHAILPVKKYKVSLFFILPFLEIKRVFNQKMTISLFKMEVFSKVFTENHKSS